MSEVNVAEVVMNEYMEAEHADRLIGTLETALEGLSEFLALFPEVTSVYDGLALKSELAHRLKMPILSAYAIGCEVTRKELQGGK